MSEVKEVTLKEATAKFFRKMMISKDGELSFTKLGVGIFTMCLMVSQMPQAGIFPPDVVVNIAKMGAYMGAWLGLVGARDAMKK